MLNIAVIGRGVVGLSCGVILARHGHSVTLISRPPAGEVLTSAVAAAFWFPYLTAVDPAAGFTEADLAGPTLERLCSLAVVPEACVSVVSGVEYVGESGGGGGLGRAWWHDRAEVAFRPLSPAELPIVPEFGPLVAGCEFRVPVAYMPGYLARLGDEFARAGGVERRAEVRSLDALAGYDVLVNCAGVDAAALTGDGQLEAVRGQVVAVRDVPYPHDRLYFLHRGDRFERQPVYIVPRGRDVILGGTADPVPAALASLTSAEVHAPSADATLDIIRRCALLRPEFAAAREYEVKVGLRPCRVPVRIEWDGGTYRTPVVHCYGHGGAGVTLSWGSAEMVARLVDQHATARRGS